MRILVIDTATRACSVALFDGHEIIASHHEIIGRGHAEKLLPIIKELPGSGRSDHIWVNIGPGSFTGIRVGISAAKALAFAWKISCSGYNCLSLVAAMADGEGHVDVAMVGGHGEYYFQNFDGGRETGPIKSLPPKMAAKMSRAPIIAGDAAQALADLRGEGRAMDILPNAQYWPKISGHDSLPPSPLYIRAPDAKPAMSPPAGAKTA